MRGIIELNSRYSTTRRVRQAEPITIAAELKAASRPGDQFESLVFLPEGEGRKGEGGLRTRGYFKQTQKVEPLITVITVVFNGVAHLEETILSVLNQTYDNVEYIIIDGGSTDGTLDIIRKYQDALDYWVSEQDGGIYNAMNKGSILAHGRGITFLNSGDFYVGTVISSVIPTIVAAKKRINNVFYEIKRRKIYYGMPVSHQACVYRNKHMLFDESFKIVADYDYTIRQDILNDEQLSKDHGFVLLDMNGVSARRYWKRDVENAIVIYRRFGLFYSLIFIFKQIPKNIVRSLKIC